MAEKSSSALLIVDVQRDFCRGGALAVPDGDSVVPVLNRCIDRLAPRGVPIYASRDWHPPVTSHFKAYGGLWPPHCVQGGEGAQFHPDLLLPSGTIIVTKGDRPGEDGYSGFEGHTPSGILLLDDLRRRGIGHLYVGGLATDYCVKSTVLDALEAGLQATVLTDAVAGVEVQPGDSARAIQAMTEAGARFAKADSLG